MLPNFLIIGSGKAATTSIIRQLREHPQIFVSQPRETHYFSFEFGRGFQWYRGLFEGSDACPARGEGSVTYTLCDEYPGTAERIRSALDGSVKLIYIMRNPIDGMVSHFTHDVLNGHIPTGSDFRSEISVGSKYLKGRLYHRQIEEYLRHFPVTDMLFLTYESYVAQPAAVLACITEFIGADKDFAYTIGAARNVSESRVRYPAWYRFARNIYRKINTLARVPGLRAITSNVRGVATKNAQSVAKPDISDEDRRRLEALFADDLAALSAFFRRDMFAYWGLQKPPGLAGQAAEEQQDTAGTAQDRLVIFD